MQAKGFKIKSFKSPAAIFFAAFFIALPSASYSYPQLKTRVFTCGCYKKVWGKDVFAGKIIAELMFFSEEDWERDPDFVLDKQRDNKSKLFRLCSSKFYNSMKSRRRWRIYGSLKDCSPPFPLFERPFFTF